MKILKIFLKDCFTSFWFWISVVLNIITLSDIYFKILANFSYMTPILCSLVVISSIITCYSLYLKVAYKYPYALIEEHKEVEFEDFYSFFEIEKLSKRIRTKYKIYITEDDSNFRIDNCYENCVTIQFFNKIYINNLTKNEIEITKPIINLVSINNVSDEFFINRLKVSLGKVRFSNQRYIDHFDYMPYLAKKKMYEFPYRIKSKDNLCMFLYYEIDLDSYNEKEFNELLNWIRNINLSINIPLIKTEKEIANKFNIKYNLKNDLIKNKIVDKLKSEEEFRKIFE